MAGHMYELAIWFLTYCLCIMMPDRTFHRVIPGKRLFERGSDPPALCGFGDMATFGIGQHTMIQSTKRSRLTCSMHL